MGTEGRNGARAVHVQLQQTTGVSAANDLPGLNLRRKGGNAVEAALPGRSRGGREGTEPPWRTSPRCLCLCRCSGSGLERGAWAGTSPCLCSRVLGVPSIENGERKPLLASAVSPQL